MKLASRLLAAILPSTVAGRSALGDLMEEYHRRPRGVWRQFWFWGVTLDLIVRYLPARLAGVSGGLGRDLVHATRLCRRYPALVLGAGLSLSLAIGVGTSAFSLANGAWLRSQLTRDASLIKIWRTHKNGASMAWPRTEFAQLRELPTLVTIEGAVPTTQPVGTTVTSIAAEAVSVAFVTGGYLSMLKAGPFTGRLLNSDDDRAGAAAVVVVDHLYWRRHFGADRQVLGRRVIIRGTEFTVVGVADRDFTDPTGRWPVMWAPLSALDHLAPAGTKPQVVEPWAIGRLNHGATIAQADAELTSLLPRVVPAPNVKVATGVDSGPVVSAEEVSTNGRILIGVLSSIALVLLLACANVSNLQLSGAAARRQEIAIRLACGASRGRIVRQLLTESALLSVVAGTAGLLMAGWLAPLLASGIGMADADVEPDLRVYAFAAIASTIAAIGTGLAPALYGARHTVSTGLKGSRPGDGLHARPSRARSIFIGIQAAASIVLVVVASLQVRALVRLAWMDPGFDVSKVLSVSVSPPRSPDAEARANAFWPVALERVQSIPGVERAALATFTPLGISLGDPDTVVDNGTDAGYFSTIGLRLVRGRSYTGAEAAAHEPVAVISDQVARRFWGDENPVGTSASRIDPNFARFQIIGVAANAFADRVEHHPYIVYLPLAFDGFTQMAVRAEDPVAIAAAVRESLRGLAPDLRPTVSVTAEVYQRQFERPRRYAALAASIALFALVLSVVGLFGVTAFAVRTRTREIGIRLALGARAVDVTRLLVLDGLRPVLFGLMFGLAGALVTGRFAAGLFFGLSSRDPLAMTVAVAILLTTATAAVIIPTRRAARLDPAIVLRES